MMNPYTCRDLKLAATLLREAHAALQDALADWTQHAEHLMNNNHKAPSPLLQETAVDDYKILLYAVGFLAVALILLSSLLLVVYRARRQYQAARRRQEQETMQLYQMLLTTQDHNNNAKSQYRQLRNEISDLKTQLDAVATTTQQLLLLESGIQE
mmetsp:Transcript_14192/g.39296  ORF Transcript_14192/g.39296 Transcript_14192/m.39296 type:complete len:155 (+) Transcript_14192:1145-1609(+)